MSGGEAVAAACSFVWLGMVLAISFLEAPLKFRAPEVTLRIGLGIGRVVFRALNVAEGVWALVILAAVALDRFGATPRAVALLPVAVLVLQLLLVRPRLARRTRAVLAGESGGGSHAHYAYVALEAVKVVALVVTGTWLLAGS